MADAMRAFFNALHPFANEGGMERVKNCMFIRALTRYCRDLFRGNGKKERRMVNTAPQRGIDLAAYMGRWYEQARYDHAFEYGLDRVFTDYAMLPDGWVRISNSGQDGSGKSHRAVGMGSCPRGDGRLRVSFVPPYSWFTAPYHILYATPGYTGAVVSGEDDRYLWLLTRERRPGRELMQTLMNEARSRGFDTARLRFTEQTVD